MKEKKVIAPNECSFGRWVAVLLVGLLLGIILSMPLDSLAKNRVDHFMGVSYADIFGILMFIPLSLGMAISLRFLGKTSIKDFILGVGGTVNKKECLTVLGLYIVGLLIFYLPNLGYISLRGVNPGEFAFLFVFMLLFAWIQTTWEELAFRGFLFRWACKNNAAYTKKAMIAAVISALIFALMHAPNPEVTSQKGIFILLALLSYGFFGFVFFLANVHFGSLMPGIVMHWINNFVCYTLISSDVSAAPVPTLLVDSTPQSGVMMLASNIVVCLPLLAYILVDIRKRKKAPSEYSN